MQLIINLIKELRDKGKCILVSSHQLALIEGICEDICIIDKGVCTYSGSVSDLKRKYGSNYLYFSTKSNVKGIKAEKFAPQSYRIKLEKPEDFRNKLEEILNNKIDIDTIERKELNLQEIFVEMASDKV
jgi:ABC-2 type transport system ATP-binding protein